MAKFNLDDCKTVRGVFLYSNRPSWWRRVLFFLRHWRRWKVPADMVCGVCGEAGEHVQTEACAGCGVRFCDDCGDWCHAPEDEPNGDYFCEECQEPKSITVTRCTVCDGIMTFDLMPPDSELCRCDWKEYYE
jgi:hypothetical protein